MWLERGSCIPYGWHNMVRMLPTCLLLVLGSLMPLPVSGQGGNPYDADPAARRAGSALFATRCADCHGADLDQDVLQLTIYSGLVSWMEPVTDKVYKAPPGN